MSQGDPVRNVLEHHGVKGMKWGVRKDDPGGNRLRRLGKKPSSPPSEDKSRAEAVKAKVTKSGSTHALSNAELQDLVKRMNLEQQFSRMSPPRVSVGKKAAKVIVKNAGEVTTNVAKRHATEVFTAATAPYANKLAQQLAAQAKTKNR